VFALDKYPHVEDLVVLLSISGLGMFSFIVTFAWTGVVLLGICFGAGGLIFAFDMTIWEETFFWELSS